MTAYATYYVGVWTSSEEGQLLASKEIELTNPVSNFTATGGISIDYSVDLTSGGEGLRIYVQYQESTSSEWKTEVSKDLTPGKQNTGRFEKLGSNTYTVVINDANISAEAVQQYEYAKVGNVVVNNPIEGVNVVLGENKITVTVTADSLSSYSLSCYLTEKDGTKLQEITLNDQTKEVTFNNIQADHGYKVYVNTTNMADPSSNPYWVEDVNVPYIVLNITIDSSKKLDVQVKGISTDYYSGTMGLYTNETCSKLVKDEPQQMGTNPVGSGFIMDFNQVSGTYYIGIIGKRTSSDTDTILYTEKVVT
jgi:hypothetical protein